MMNVKEFFMVLGVLLFIIAGVLRYFYGKKFIIMSPYHIETYKDNAHLAYEREEEYRKQITQAQMIIDSLLAGKHKAEEYAEQLEKESIDLHSRYVRKDVYDAKLKLIEELNKDKEYLQQQVVSLTNQNARFAKRIRKAEGNSRHVSQNIPVANGAGYVECTCGWRSPVIQDADEYKDGYKTACELFEAHINSLKED